MKIEIEESKPNFEKIAETIKLGPQKEIMENLDLINDRWLTTNWTYGNRSSLTPIDPLTVTKTFRWGRGYKAKILECIDTRFTQYSKPSNSLHSLFNREVNSKFYKEQFVNKVLDLEEKMQHLRASGISFDDNSELFKEHYQSFKDYFIQQKSIAMEINKSNPNIEITMELHRVDTDSLDYATINDRTLTDIEKESISWEQTYVVQTYKWKNPEMPFVNGDNETIHSHKLEGDLILSFYFKVDNYLHRQLSTKDEITCDNFNSTTMTRNGNRYSNSLSSRTNFNTYWNWGVVGNYTENHNENSDAWNFDGRSERKSIVTAYPYVGGRDSSELPDEIKKVTMIDSNQSRNVCLGDLTTPFINQFIAMNPMGILAMFNSWNTWHILRSNPLQGIHHLFNEKSPSMKDVWLDIGYRHSDVHWRLTVMYQVTFGDNWSNDASLIYNWSDFMSNNTNENINRRIIRYLGNETHKTSNPYNILDGSDSWSSIYFDLHGDNWGRYFITEHIINARMAMLEHCTEENCMDYKLCSKEDDLYEFLEFVSRTEEEEADIALVELETDIVENLDPVTIQEMLENAGFSIESQDHDTDSELPNEEDTYTTADMETEMEMWVQANTRRNQDG